MYEKVILQSGYLGGLRSSLGGWTQKVKSWYWGRPLVSFRSSSTLIACGLIYIDWAQIFYSYCILSNDLLTLNFFQFTNTQKTIELMQFLCVY